MATINIHEFRQVVEFNIDNGIKRSILGLGASGIGKSAIIAEICEERKIGMIDLRLLLYTETELKGIPFPSADNKTTLWLQNDILPREDRDGKEGILLIEELTSAPRKVQAAAYQLIYDRKLGSYTLPEGWYIVALGNKKDDNGVWSSIPAPLANRFEIHDITYDLKIWREDFAYKAGVDSRVIAYLNFSPSSFHNFNPEIETFTFASPRSWVAVSDIIKVGGLPKNLLQAKIEANVGEVEGAKFMSFIEDMDNIDIIDDVLAGKNPKAPKEDDKRYIVCTSLVNMFKFLQDKKTVDKKEVKQFVAAVEWLLTLPVEFVALTIGDLYHLNKELVRKMYMEDVDSPAFINFLQENKYLFE